MPRFFVNNEGADAGRLFVSGDDARHIARSMRMAVGEEITLCTPDGIEHLCRLVKIRDELCECSIVSSQASNCEPPYALTLFMAYPKGDKLETIIQKAVELGACRIVPFVSSRCIKRPDEKRSESRLDRLNKIAEEAAKQCGRATLPKVTLPISFEQMLSDAASHEFSLFCYEGRCSVSIKQALNSLGSAPKSICVVVGSEGGFSPEEAENAESAGLTAVNMGPRILRCETAPLYALTAISCRFEI